MLGITEYIAMALGASLLALQLYTSSVIASLEADVAKAEKTLVVSEINNSTLQKAIESANARVKLEHAKVLASKKEVEEWRNKPDVIKYKTLYKRIPEWVDVRKEDCETTKSVIAAVRDADL